MFKRSLMVTLCLLLIASTMGFGVNPKQMKEDVVTKSHLVSANDDKVIEMLKESGVISEKASHNEALTAMGSYIKNLEKNTFKNDGQLKDREVRRSNVLMDKYMNSKVFKGNGNKLGQSETVAPIEQETYDGSVKADNVLAILINFPDYNANDITPDLTDMYYDDYTREHYQEMLFSPTGYEGPNGENFISMKQYYESQSGGSYTVNGEVTNWYTAKKPAAYYGGNDNDNGARELVMEALTAVAADPSFDLTKYDKEDRYDLDNDGDYNEPDGLVDHLMIFHSSVGEEAGGGALGDDAIWSHRWNLGGVFTLPGTTADADYWGGELAAYDYTIQPADGAAGVCAHEFGHDLGLPDEYDTQYSGNGEAVGYWSIMSSGSWAGVIPGTEPTGFSAWAKEFFQATMGGNWLHGIEISLEDLNEGNVIAKLDEASSKGTNNDAIKITLPQKVNSVVAPVSGENMYFSGKGNDMQNYLIGSVDLTNASNASLNFSAWYQIEQDWDYAGVFAIVDGNLVSLEGNITTTDNPYDQNFGYGITGFSEGWVNASFDLSNYVGSELTFAIGYITDPAVSEAGLYVDDLQVVADDQQILFDDAEGDALVALEGFVVDKGISYSDHYYLLEWRNHAGVDQGLAHIQRGNSLMSYAPGLLIWYVDNAYDNNWVGYHPANGFLGVVDADQSIISWSDKEYASSKYQIHDATFSLEKPENMTLDYKALLGITLKDNKSNFNTEFNDSNSYINSKMPDWGRDIPKLGLQIRVIGEASDRSVGEVLIGN